MDSERAGSTAAGKMRKGFSLIESMLSLGLTLAVVLGGMEFFGISRSFFLRLKDKSEDRRAALAALDKIEEDVRRAGYELALPAALGLIQGLAAGPDRLMLESAEDELLPTGDIQPGQTRIPVQSTGDVRAGRRLCLMNDSHAQIVEVTAVEDDDLLISPEADGLYLKEESRILPLSKVEYYLDAGAGVVRRRADGGGGQPLLESVSRMEFIFVETANLLTVRLALRAGRGRFYESTFFPKNLAPAFQW